MMALFLSTLSLRRATDCAGCALKKYLISIHALLAESDDSGPRKIKVDFLFLSTLSLRRATAQVCQVVSAELYFYPRSPCGERLHHHLIPNSGTLHFYPRRVFLSTLSLRRATIIEYKPICVMGISIHALLAESDKHVSATVKPGLTFLSTLSLRRATIRKRQIIPIIQFLSTLSLRRATMCHRVDTARVCISIHALLAESDPRA